MYSHTTAASCKVLGHFRCKNMKNCGKDDMEMCYYPAFIIVNSFQKTFERMMCQNLSYLIFVCVMANAFVTKFIVIQKLRTPKNL